MNIKNITRIVCISMITLVLLVSCIGISYASTTSD